MNDLIEQILQNANLTNACKEVVRNKGVGGVDHMRVEELKGYLDTHRETLTHQVRNCEYHAQPIRGKEISKGNGKTRLLGIPTVIDRILHELDTEMERRELLFVRYADDFSIYCKSEAEAKRMGNSIFKFLRDKLRLPINKSKSGICRPVNFTVLGHGFVPIYKKGVKGKYQLIVAKDKWKVFKNELKKITRKTSPMSFDERIERLTTYINGWIESRKYANIKIKLAELDGWLRNRLRGCIWHDWKKPERKRKNLIRLGIPPDQAYAWSRTNMGRWAVAQSPILGTTITISRLKKRGYVSLSEVYEMKTATLANNKHFPMF